MTDKERLPYGRQWIDEADVEAVARVLRSDWLTTGPAVSEFERALAARGGADHCVAVNSGTAALHAAYAAAGVGTGDDIVTSPLTFVATASAALHLGAEVRFADVDPGTGNMDPAAAGDAISERTRLLVPVDYAGHPADYSRLRKIADRHGLSIVADAAHSFGACLDGHPVGSLADATALSFHPVKLMTTAEGGAVLMNDPEWCRRAGEFRSHGIVRDPRRHRHPDGAWHYEVQSLGFNYRIPDVLCALGLSQLRKLDDFLERRRRIADRYTEALGDVPGLVLPVTEPGAEPAWHLYVLRVAEQDRREALFDRLQAEGLGVQQHYLPVYLHPVFRDMGYTPGRCPNAEAYAASAISIPIFPAMTKTDVDRVIDTVTSSARALL